MQKDRRLTKNDIKTVDCQTLQNDRGLSKLPMIIAANKKFRRHLICNGNVQWTCHSMQLIRTVSADMQWKCQCNSYVPRIRNAMEMPMQFNTYCFIFQNSLKILLFLLPSGGMGRITRNATPLMRIGRSIERNCSETQLLFARGEPSRYSAGRSHSQTVAERKVLLIPILLDEPFRSGFSIARPCKQMYIFCMCISFLRFALEGFATSRYSYYCSARLRSIYIVYRLHCRTCVILL